MVYLLSSSMYFKRTARASNIASKVYLIMRLSFDFPMRYANDNDCCDSPDARKRKVTASFPPAVLLCVANICVFLCNNVFCKPKQKIESFRRHPNVPKKEV